MSWLVSTKGDSFSGQDSRFFLRRDSGSVEGVSWRMLYISSIYRFLTRLADHEELSDSKYFKRARASRIGLFF